MLDSTYIEFALAASVQFVVCTVLQIRHKNYQGLGWQHYNIA